MKPFLASHTPDKTSEKKPIHCSISCDRLAILGNIEKGEGLTDRWWNSTWLLLLRGVIPLGHDQPASGKLSAIVFQHLTSRWKPLLPSFIWDGVVALGTNVTAIMTDFWGEWGKGLPVNLLFTEKTKKETQRFHLRKWSKSLLMVGSGRIHPNSASFLPFALVDLQGKPSLLYPLGATKIHTVPWDNTIWGILEAEKHLSSDAFW